MASTTLNSNYKLYFFDCIRQGNLDEVITLADKIPKIRRAFVDDELKSAVAVSLEANQFTIYKFLISNGFRLGPQENYSDYVKTISDQNIIREINKWFSNDSFPQEIMLLCSSKLSYNTPVENKARYYKLLRQTFTDLNKDPWIQEILKLIAKEASIEIIFDFEQDSCDHMDPAKIKGVTGTTYIKDRCILVGAKGLANENGYAQVYGTLAHELYHFAMDILYENDCKPFHKGDNERESLFKEVYLSCEKKKHLEEVISWVYPDIHSFYKCFDFAELIVRVPHILARDVHDPHSKQIVESLFPELFGFFYNYVLPDLKKQQPFAEAKFVVKEVNALCGLSTALKESKLSLTQQRLEDFKINLNADDKIIAISSSCLQVTSKAVYDQLSVQPNFQWSIIFVRLETFANEKIFKCLAKAWWSCLNPLIVVHCDKSVASYPRLQFALEMLKQSRIESRIIFIGGDDFFCGLHQKFPAYLEVTHTWSELEENAKEQAIEHLVDFQGTQVTLKELISLSCEQLEDIPLQMLINDKEVITVGVSIEIIETEFYIDRTFLPFDQQTEDTAIVSKNLDDVVEEVINHQVILLADDPGSGKTIEFQKAASKLKEKYKSHWVVYMNFKEISQKVRKHPLEFSVKQELEKFLIEIILKLNKLDNVIFSELFLNDKVFFLFDGFDEMSPESRKHVIKLLKAIENLTLNHIWISSRANLAPLIRDEFELSAYKLQPFTKEDQKEFFRRYFTARYVNERSIEKVLEEIENFVNSVKPDSWSGDSIANPLVNRMIAELFFDKDFKHEVLQSNYYSIYDEYTKKTFKNVYEMHKDHYCNGETFEGELTYLEVYLRKSFVLLANHELEIKSAIESFLYDFNSDFYNEGNPNINGMKHQTHAEFFIADFVYKTAFKELASPQKLLKIALDMFYSIITDEENFEVARIFLDNAMGRFVFEEGSREVEALKEIFVKIFNDHKSVKVFLSLVRGGCSNLIRIFSLYLFKQQDLNEYLLGGEYIRETFRLLATVEPIVLKNASKCLHELADENETAGFFKKIIEKVESCLTPEEFQSRLNSEKEIEFLIDEITLTVKNRCNDVITQTTEGLNLYTETSGTTNTSTFNGTPNDWIDIASQFISGSGTAQDVPIIIQGFREIAPQIVGEVSEEAVRTVVNKGLNAFFKFISKD